MAEVDREPRGGQFLWKEKFPFFSATLATLATRLGLGAERARWGACACSSCGECDCGGWAGWHTREAHGLGTGCG